jgi:lipoprotein signal peptidase
LLSSGLIAGEGIMGVLIAGYAVWTTTRPEGVSFGLTGVTGDWVSFIIFSAMGYFLFRLAVRKKKVSQ